MKKKGKSSSRTDGEILSIDTYALMGDTYSLMGVSSASGW